MTAIAPIPAAPRPSHGPLPRRILFLAVPIFCLFLVIRTVGVEPYGVPTGSMAPALVGNHRETFCPRCGYRVIVGEPSRDRTDPYPLATCPNCGRDGIDLSASQDIPGDRLLVDKNVFSLRSPRRWEVAVFHCPVDTTTPYVKRVVGLPGEAVQVIGGDVFANGTILRKTLSELREVRVPVFDMNFAPPGGWAVRWLIAPLAANPPQPNSGVTPDGAVVDESVLKDGVLTLDAASAPNAAVGLTYRHWNLDRKTEEPVRDRLAYNDASSNRAKSPVDVHDFLVEFDLEWGAGTGSFAMRLGDGLDSVSAELGSESVKLGPDGGDPGVKPGFHPIPGRTYHLAFAFADRRASLAVDGKEMLPPVDLPADPAALSRRVGVSHPLQFGARGVRVAVKNLILYRDVHYRSDGPNGTRLPYQLGPNEYFMLGDNSANSADSRVWTKPKTGAAAGVPERDFIGKPFLIHQPLRLGRLRVNGRDRTFQTVDWSRVKWVR